LAKERFFYGGEKMKEATILKKSGQVQELTKKFQDAASLVFVDHLGLTVEQLTDLRVKLYAQNCEMHVIKNNILRRTSEALGYEGIQPHLVGPNAVAISKDATSASKILFEFAKKNDKLQVKAGVIEGKVYESTDLKVLANLPDKNGMLSMLLSVLQAPIRNLAVVVKAVAEKNA
jgi:large subunit ribosomal protein L10